ncbi:MAG: hypothetical protein QM784_05530 [Polyangiaceae bacterium]
MTENALPLTAAAGLGTMPLTGFSTSGSPSDPSVACGVGTMCNYGSGVVKNAFSNSGLTNSLSFGKATISQTLRALERDGLVKTLAEPNLTAVSGETAKFLAGGEYPVPVVDSSGALSVTFKEFGVGLAFTPVVLSEGRISLKIETRGERAVERRCGHA